MSKRNPTIYERVCKDRKLVIVIGHEHRDKNCPPAIFTAFNNEDDVNTKALFAGGYGCVRHETVVCICEEECSTDEAKEKARMQLKRGSGLPWGSLENTPCPVHEWDAYLAFLHDGYGNK